MSVPAILKSSWPVLFGALPFTIVHCVILFAFAEAFDAQDAMWPTLETRGPTTLLGLNAGIFGWVSLVILERRVSTGGFVLFSLAIPWWVAGFVAVLTFTWLSPAPLPQSITALLILSVACAVAAGAFRAYLD